MARTDAPFCHIAEPQFARERLLRERDDPIAHGRSAVGPQHGGVFLPDDGIPWEGPPEHDVHYGLGGEIADCFPITV